MNSKNETTKFVEANHDRLIPLPEVIRIVGLGKTCIYAMVREGEFPRQVILRSRSSRWVESDVRKWLSSRIGGSYQHRKN